MHYFRRMIDFQEQVALCALNRIFGYHPTLAMALMEKAGSALALFDGKWKPPGQAGGDVMPGPDRASHPELFAQLGPAMLDWAAGELDRIRERGFRFLGYTDPEYPTALREIPDAPLGLYLNGSTPPTQIFDLHPMVGVVGTRDLSAYGRSWCRKLVEGLAQARVQPCIVSGMALGTDGIAHQSALECGLTTIGVLPTGIDKVYPWQHERLAMSMVQTPGCGLVTDYPLGTAPVALNFLRRNRIIAALTHAVVVVESKTKGGSLMTARYAVEYDREVYALPGRIDDIRSAGCNSLIRENMAEIITSPEDLVARLGLGGSGRKTASGSSWATESGASLRSRLVRKYGELSAQVRIGEAVKENLGITVDALSARLIIPYQEVLAAVTVMEADGILTMDLLGRCALTPGYS